jgi:transcriptional regulator with XRE-family HTH domain
LTTVPPEGGSGSGPTVLRMLLGAHLRRLREAQGITREMAGWEIRASESKISRMELGRVSFKERDVADLLTLYGILEREERDALLTLARNANEPGWWHREGDILPNWFQSYLGLESAASLIRTYEVQFVPGLLQTPEYARAVIQLGHQRAPTAELDRRVGVRIARQQLLRREDPPQVWVVIDAGVLRRPIGGLDVMRAQILALMEASKLPNLRLQVIPFYTGGHAGAAESFTILRFPDQDLPDVVYIEHLNSALYLDKREDVELYAAVMERLCVEAELPTRTPEILKDILGGIEAQTG